MERYTYEWRRARANNRDEQPDAVHAHEPLRPNERIVDTDVGGHMLLIERRTTFHSRLRGSR